MAGERGGERGSETEYEEAFKDKNYYEILGVLKDARPEYVKAAYRRLALQYHPDRNPGDKVAEAKFKKIALAYEILGDPNKRSLYDMKLENEYARDRTQRSYGKSHSSSSAQEETRRQHYRRQEQTQKENQSQENQEPRPKREDTAKP